MSLSLSLSNVVSPRHGHGRNDVHGCQWLTEQLDEDSWEGDEDREHGTGRRCGCEGEHGGKRLLDKQVFDVGGKVDSL